MRQEWEPGFQLNGRGFDLVLFEDAYGKVATVQQSSAIGEYDEAFDAPGASALWVGLGTQEWMHLSREQVAGLRDLFDRWLRDGRLHDLVGTASAGDAE